MPQRRVAPRQSLPPSAQGRYGIGAIARATAGHADLPPSRGPSAHHSRQPLPVEPTLRAPRPRSSHPPRPISPTLRCESRDHRRERRRLPQTGALRVGAGPPPTRGCVPLATQPSSARPGALRPRPSGLRLRPGGAEPLPPPGWPTGLEPCPRHIAAPRGHPNATARDSTTRARYLSAAPRRPTSRDLGAHSRHLGSPEVTEALQGRGLPRSGPSAQDRSDRIPQARRDQTCP